MDQVMTELSIAEIPYETGQVHYRYSRYLSDDGERWIRHGLFRAYYIDGTLASEGSYHHGLEHGLWRDYHVNGRLAAEGRYDCGVEVGTWSYWNPSGRPEEPRTFSE
jgi:antitoxin component YwqK of YwqJK toxin-antitoxin module